VSERGIAAACPDPSVKIDAEGTEQR
jgi:hypothetical protein